MKNLVKAIIAVMGEVENIDKKMVVGSGQNAYNGVSDKDVKLVIGKAMQKHGLVMLPIEVNADAKVERWQEDTYYNGQKSGVKSKQSVFTQVNTRYLLMHESGESMEIVGYGHGIDSQDKSAGKATTYALKNALLYTFLVPTGGIDDTDKTHSDDLKIDVSTESKQDQTPKSIITPGLKKVVEGAESLSALNTIWRNNKKLHEDADFLKAVAIKRLEFVTTTEEVTKVFDTNQSLHSDAEFVKAITCKKKDLQSVDSKKATA
ncbi:ERF family protein [Sphingobacterium corticis]|uniref:ERF family protein n=1 Tax=Sphingobacterium corticis TaxID=1812823 RepID=A0ABW5NQU0_9SPHI